jgi:hypothetical protein
MLAAKPARGILDGSVASLRNEAASVVDAFVYGLRKGANQLGRGESDPFSNRGAPIMPAPGAKYLGILS